MPSSSSRARHGALPSPAPLLLLVLLIGALPATLAAEGGLRYTVTLSEFDNEAGWHGRWDVGSAWDTVMTDLLSQTNRFIVLGESSMRNAAMDEQDLATSGRTAQGAKTPVTGQLTPAQLLVKGSITHVQESTSGTGGGIRIKKLRIGGKKSTAEMNATIYVVDSTTGQVLASKSVVGTSNSKGGSLGYSGAGWAGDVDSFKNDNVGKALEAAVAAAVDWMISELPDIPWTAAVALVQGDKVYVNRGTREGVGAGQVFVVGEPTVIRDPATGEVLDEIVNEVARLSVETVKEKVCICSVMSGSAANLQPGMAVHVP